MISRIDAWLLDRFQGLSDWLHGWTGLDCIIQARACSAISSALWAVEVFKQMNTFGWFAWAGMGCVAISLVRALWELPGDEAARQAGDSGCRNPRRICCQTVRLILSGLFGVFAVLRIATLYLLGFQSLEWGDWLLLLLWAGSYLEACDAQTPKTGKIREGLNQLAESMGRKLVRQEASR